MNATEWARVRAVFEDLLDLPAEARELALLDAPDTDPDLRREIGRLLELHDGAGEFLEKPLARLIPDDEPEPPRPGDRVGAYRLVREIARGGMGLVYVAERADDLFEKKIAVKFLRANAMTDDDRDRFAHERRVLACVDHPVVARIIDGGETAEGWPYLMMDLVDGRPLTRFCREEEKGLEVRLELLAEVCRGLQAAHRLGVAHGDVKPGNVLVTALGEPRIVDFGIAAGIMETYALSTDRLALTPAYASPEQRRGEPATISSDIYSLGILLFELLVGRLPRLDEECDRESVSRAIRSHSPSAWGNRSSMARSLGYVIARATMKRPEDRYASADELAREVDRILAGMPPVAMEGHPVPRLLALAFRYRLRIAISIGLLLAGGVAWAALEARTRERVEKTRRFVAKAQRIDYESKLETMLPRHDTRPFRARLRERVTEIGRDLEQDWPAPVHYALGMGELQLGEYEAARDHLEAAWTGGLDSPEVALALVQALGRSYAEELRRADETLDPDATAQRRQTVIKHYRDRVSGLGPILEELRGPDLEYLRAFSDHLTGQSNRALARLHRLDPERKDSRTAPLEGDILMSQSMAVRATDPEQALEYLDGAAAAYAHAKKVWRSDPAIHLADCDRAVSATSIRWMIGEPVLSLDPVLEICSEALEIDPGSPAILVRKARLFTSAAQEDLLQGRNPAKNAQRALASGRQVRGDPEWVGAAQKYFGLVLSLRAKWELVQGRDPTPMLDRSIQHFEAALRVSPRDAASLNNLGNVWGIRYRYLEQSGRASTGPLNHAVEAYQRALAIEPLPMVHTNLGIGYQKHAELAMRDGDDPSGWIDRARLQLARALELAPRRAVYWERAAGVDLVAARFAIQSGEDPSPDLESALTKARTAVELDSKCADCRLTLAEALLFRSRADLEAGLPSVAPLEEIDTLLEPHADTARGVRLVAQARGLSATVHP